MVANMISARKVVEEVNHVAESLKDGNLSYRVRAGNAEGIYLTLVEGFNSAIDNIVNPIKEAINVLEKLAERDLTARMLGS